MIRIALLAALSTACAVTVRVGNPHPLDGDYRPPVIRSSEVPAAAATPAPTPVVKSPVKRVAKKKPAPKPTAETCEVKRKEADACDAAVKVETCKAACEPPPASTPAP